MTSTLGPRRLYTETWTLGVEKRFLGLIGFTVGQAPFVPVSARVYTAFGFVLFQVYGTDGAGYVINPRGDEPVRRWKLRYIGRQARNLP